MTTESNTPQSRADFLASLFAAYQAARPLSFMRQWRPEDLLEAGIPREWLEQNHLVKGDGSTTDLPNRCSQRQFAEIATKTFGKAVNQSTVSRAIKDGLSVAVAAGRLKTDAALQWWRANKTASVEEVASEAEHRRERQRIAREREQLELEEIQRQKSGKWISTDTASQIASGAMRQYHDYLKGLLETVSPEKLETFCVGIGLTPAQNAAMKDFLVNENRRVIDDLETEAERRASEYSQQLKTEIKNEKKQPA
jgi:hypothetical protein